MYCLQEVVGAVGDVSEGDTHTAVWHANAQWMQLMLQGQMSVDVTVTGANSGGLVVQYEQLRGFIPASHLGRVRSMLALDAAAAAAPICLQSMCSACAVHVHCECRNTQRYCCTRAAASTRGCGEQRSRLRRAARVSGVSRCW